jgi:hypothetical protein
MSPEAARVVARRVELDVEEPERFVQADNTDRLVLIFER